MGGRAGYPDERPPGRFAGRSSGGYQGGYLICATFCFKYFSFFLLKTIDAFDIFAFICF